MTSRMTEETVTFRHPFRIAGVDDDLPAGNYPVETDEERLEDVSFPAYRRLATYIHLRGRPGTGEVGRVVAIDPADLAAALAKDAEAGGAPVGRPASGGKAAGSLPSLPIDDRLSPAPLRVEASSIAAGLPKFVNDLGVAEIRIGTREFHCIGASPPQDHPHIYLNMGDGETIICPYCATVYRFNLQVGPSAADPPSCFNEPAAH